MLYFTLPMILSVSILFSQLTHPLSMGLTLLIQTILICLLTGTFNPSFWFSYILFLIFLGGMLILFIYVASLASNEPFRVSPFLLVMTTVITLLSLTLMTLDPLSFKQPFFTCSSEYLSLNKAMPSHPLTNMIYSLPSSFLTVFMISYLLITLLVVVKIINTSASPLRPSN
uniref:NADH-ubiquinone oxidoreductase chain 6 n=1 Tax=Geocharax gracilis TaxID=119071 RepID=W8ZSY5_9EUCA|nr:NADH dehydrogenase subunit 6 [Geocharax gracilis]CDN85552.1 NADH dehydrogenase subunit 6 [Geocharax gracilis]